jgi:glycosyltransferase involved in cell wall biosynthesis
MRIVIDMQGMQGESSYRGIGRYTSSLIQAMVRNNIKHDIILILNSLFSESIELVRSAFQGILPQEKIRVWYSPNNVRSFDNKNKSRREVAELIREAFIDSLCPDIVLVTSLFEGYIDDAITNVGSTKRKYKTVLICYDLIPLIFPKEYLEKDKKYELFYKRKLSELVKADAWFAISESGKRDAIDLLGLDESRLTNISAACDQKFNPITLDAFKRIEIKNKYDIKRPFIFYTGGGDYRKNLPTMIRVFLRLQANLRLKYQLVISGRIHNIPALKSLLNGKVGDDEVLFLGVIPDNDLKALYNLCTLFFFPSLYEGFGLPVLEAMACDAPVIASNTSSIPEVLANEDAMFDPANEDNILLKLNQALTDSKFRADLIENGRKRTKLFSWDLCATKALNVFEKLNLPTQKPMDSFQFKSNNIQDLIKNISKFGSNFGDDDLRLIASAIAFNHPIRNIKKIFVDVSELIHRDAATGVQRVTKNILFQLLSSPPKGYEVQAVYASIGDIGYKEANEFTARFLNTLSDRPDALIEPISGDIFLGLDLQHHTTRLQSQYLCLIRNHGVIVYFVIYDLLPIQFPQYWPGEYSIDLAHYEWLNVITQFDGAVCISKSVADELFDWLKQTKPQRLRPFNIGFFHLGADIDPNKFADVKKENLKLDFGGRLTFLMVGTVEPRKAHAEVLDVFNELWEEGVEINLVIVGKKGWLVDSLVLKMENHVRKDVNLFWFNGITDSFLNDVYTKSDCLIAASEGEGFGLPLIEAAQHGLPIIARDIPVFREVAGSYALYFSEKKDNNLRSVITNWISNIYPKKNKKKVLKFLTWAQSAKQLTDVIIKNNWSEKW